MQHQFLLNNLDESDQLQEELCEIGINENDIHFVTEVSKDFAGHHVHEASIMEETDLVHSSIRGALVGVVISIVVNALVFFTKPLGWQIELINMIFMLLLFVGFGGWIGGLVGISYRNYRLSKHEPELRKGKAIMLVYTDDEHATEAKRIVTKNHPAAKYLGKDSSFDNPLKHEKLAQMGH